MRIHFVHSRVRGLFERIKWLLKRVLFPEDSNVVEYSVRYFERWKVIVRYRNYGISKDK